MADGVDLLREARRRRPDDFWANHDLAFYLCRSDPPRFREAVGYFAAAVALRPNLAAARINLANAYRAAGDLDLAIATHREALAVEPGHAVGHNNLANALRDAGDLAGAVEHFREAVRLDPTYVGAGVRLSLSLALIGAWDDALAAARQAAAADPASAEAQVTLADALKNVGRFADAVQTFRRLRQAVDGQPLAVRVDLLVQQAERLDAITRELAGVPDDAISDEGRAEELWLCAWACYLTGRDRPAERLAARALAADPDREHAPDGDEHDLFHVFAAARGGADRSRALAWLRAALTRRTADARSEEIAKRLAARRAARRWQLHRELAGVREPAALAGLPAAERAAWEAFWKDVAGLRGSPRRSGDGSITAAPTSATPRRRAGARRVPARSLSARPG